MGLGVEAQIGFHLLRSVAFHAAILKEGANLAVEVHGRA